MRKTSATTHPAAGSRLLMVDDNPNGLTARRVVLEEKGWQVTTCLSPQEALSQISGEKFDIVITDYRMPGMNGVELISELRKLRGGLPVILMSGLVEVLGLTEVNTGADAVVAKNATEIPNMLRAVARLTAPRKPAASQASKRKRKAANE